jgi:hypothetical protein
MPRLLVLVATLLVILAGCAANDPRNLACARQAQGNQRWGYYPGYGCGPVPPAQTKFA